MLTIDHKAVIVILVSCGFSCAMSLMDKSHCATNCLEPLCTVMVHLHLFAWFVSPKVDGKMLLVLHLLSLWQMCTSNLTFL